jgi:peptidoglycan/LPS O-acetylase OafA/YrhL
MPEPVQRGQRYMPGLDGLRAIAVLAVVAFHLGFDWAPGGLLGVGIFFTLSGYLITDILLSQLNRIGHIRLGRFWLARARRLLPALFLMLVVVTAWVTVIGPAQPSQFRDAVISAALYVNNWQQIFQDVSYFARFSAPIPLNHLWSLAVEEQFYIVWPFLLLLGVRLVHESPLPSGIRPRLAGLTVLMGLASAILMAVLYHPTLDPSRVYYGTDTRASELLAGAALAMVWPSRHLKRGIAPGARNTLDGLGVAGLAIIGLLIWRTGEFSAFLYRGGFVLLSLATVLVLLPLAHPACRLGTVLGWRPLRWVGVRSYGIYLWHFPIIVLTTPSGVHAESPLRDALQVAAILAVSALSWRYVEEPIRHGAIGRLWAGAKAGGWRWERVPRQGWAVVAGAGVMLAIAFAGLAGLGLTNEPSAGAQTVAKTVTAKRVSRQPLATSCDAVVHIGDSTSEGLVSSDYLPDPKQQISAQYARVGATTQHLEVSGARSIYENFEGLPNAQEVAAAWKADGFHGCWVFALGTNEAANVAAGSTVGYEERIANMMSEVSDQPVLWVNVKSLVTTGPYAADNMRAWDKALRGACDHYPSMRVYDWASAVKDQWFIPDGIHFTTPGYAARGRLIADALLKAFPNTHPTTPTDSDNCLISSS